MTQLVCFGRLMNLSLMTRYTERRHDQTGVKEQIGLTGDDTTSEPNMNLILSVRPLLTPVVIIMMNIYYINSESIKCSDREYSPLCFCRSSYQNSSLTDVFFAKLSLSSCNRSLSIQQCHQNRFYPPPIHLTQLVPNLVNLSHCLKDLRCLHAVHSIQSCQQCQLTSSLNSFPLGTTTDLPTDSCIHICEHDKSCGFLCLNRRITISVNCSICQEQKQNIICRCIKTKKAPSCLQSSYETTTQRWMQKRGFPAAAILGLLVLAGMLLVIALKLIYRQLDLLDRRRDVHIRRSIATIITNRNRQPRTPISYRNTPQIPSIRLQTDNLMADLLNEQSRELIVDIHRCEDEEELSFILLEKTSNIVIKED